MLFHYSFTRWLIDYSTFQGKFANQDIYANNVCIAEVNIHSHLVHGSCMNVSVDVYLPLVTLLMTCPWLYMSLLYFISREAILSMMYDEVIRRVGSVAIPIIAYSSISRRKSNCSKVSMWKLPQILHYTPDRDPCQILLAWWATILVWWSKLWCSAIHKWTPDNGKLKTTWKKVWQPSHNLF